MASYRIISHGIKYAEDNKFVAGELVQKHQSARARLLKALKDLYDTKGPYTASHYSQLAKEVSIDEDVSMKNLHVLFILGLLEEEASGYYRLSSLGLKIYAGESAEVISAMNINPESVFHNQYSSQNRSLIEADKLRELIACRDEMPNVEFKLKYILTGQGKDKQRDELAKDLIALANTAGSNLNDDACVIIGASDKRNENGTRDLIDIREFSYNRKTFLDITNSSCTPPISNLAYEEVELDGTWIGVIFLTASPHIHELSRDLNPPKGLWRKNSVLIRRGDEVAVASLDEILLLKREKDGWGGDPDLERFLELCEQVENEGASAFSVSSRPEQLWAERMVDRKRLLRVRAGLYMLAHHVLPNDRNEP